MKALTWLIVLCLLGSSPSYAKISRDDFQKALEYFDQERFDDAIAVLKASLDQDPGQAAIYNLLGMIYLKQNESISSAIGSFEQALLMDPHNADVYFNLASTYAGAANRPELAAEYFKKTLEVDPKYVKAYFGLGWFTLTTLEEPVKAAEYFQKAIEYFPDFPEAYYGLGLSYIQMGKAPLALQSVTQLRSVGREDLASYLESILRGGKVSEIVQEEVSTNPVLGEAPPSSPEAASGFELESSSGGESNRGDGTSVSGSSPGVGSSSGGNPFQLN